MQVSEQIVLVDDATRKVCQYPIPRQVMADEIDKIDILSLSFCRYGITKSWKDLLSIIQNKNRLQTTKDRVQPLAIDAEDRTRGNVVYNRLYCNQDMELYHQHKI